MTNETQDHSLQEALQVVRGNPSHEELATVIAVLDAVHAEELLDGHGYERPLKSTWARNSAQLRQQITPGPGQWRAVYRY